MLFFLANISYFFAAAGEACTLPKKLFFGLPPWWQYLEIKKDELDRCAPVFKFPDDILPVGLAIVDMLLRLAGLVAIVAVIAAGVGYITASGQVEKTVQARQRIYNALIGLVIVAVASGVVAFLGNRLA